MQRKTKILSLAAATLIASTAGAMAQGYEVYGNSYGYGGPRYETPRANYYQNGPGYYGSLNGSNHPAPSSTQGDVGPQGNNNGTLTGAYRQW